MIELVNERIAIRQIEKRNIDAQGFVISEGGIVTGRAENLPKSQEGIVVAIGPGRPLPQPAYNPQTNQLMWHAPMPVKVGDYVVFSKYGGTEFEIDGKQVIVLNDLSGLIGILTEKTEALAKMLEAADAVDNEEEPTESHPEAMINAAGRVAKAVGAGHD